MYDIVRDIVQVIHVARNGDDGKSTGNGGKAWAMAGEVLDIVWNQEQTVRKI